MPDPSRLDNYQSIILLGVRLPLTKIFLTLFLVIKWNLLLTHQNRCHIPQTLSSRDHIEHIEHANDEIQPLLKKGVIVPSKHEPGEFISPIFTVPKAGDKIRLILNLKQSIYT